MNRRMTPELADRLQTRALPLLSLTARGNRLLSNLTVYPLPVTLSSNARTACHSIFHILTTNAVLRTHPKALKIYTAACPAVYF